MMIRMVHARGLVALALTTQLLQRVRLTDPVAGVWEAADPQWWWRMQRSSDESIKTFWVDDHGPVAGILQTSWNDTTVQIDPVMVSGTMDINQEMIWSELVESISRLDARFVDIPIRDDDLEAMVRAESAGFVVTESDSTYWMSAENRPEPLEPREGFTITSRIERTLSPHHLQVRNGLDVSERLTQCSLYDPSLDLVMETADGEVAGYALFWFDPVTKVGLIEPVRTEEGFQRLGIARTLLTHGIERMAVRGATRVKVSCSSEAACGLYSNVGFTKESTTTWYRLERTRV